MDVSVIVEESYEYSVTSNASVCVCVSFTFPRLPEFSVVVKCHGFSLEFGVC